MSAALIRFTRCLACAIALVAGHAPTLEAQQTSSNGGTVAGVVRDTLGRPVRDAEVVIPDASRTTRSDAEGKFTIADVVLGEHIVWVRNLGYVAAQFKWESTKGGRIDVAVKLQPLPKSLDAVNVYATEERNMKSRSIVNGVLTDTAGNPLEGAEVQLVGAQRTTYTDSAGAFVFRNVAPGDLALRARQMGYSPVTRNVTLLQDDHRSVYVKMHALAQTLDAVHITAESGYGVHQDVWPELDKRLRFRQAMGSSKVLGPERLAEAGKAPLDLLIHEVAGGSYGAASIRSDATQGKRATTVEGDACVLENGWRPNRLPLRTYGAEQLDMVEYYPASPPATDTEHTQSVAYRMSSVTGCEGMLGKHPAYYVVWLKGAKE